MALAFFDLDRTLLSVNSGSLWVAAERREGRIGAWQAVRAGWWLAAYHLGFSRIETVLEEAIASLSGELETDLRARNDAFYLREVQAKYRPGARPAVEWHRERGDVLALLTSSSVYLSAPVQAELGIPHTLCNQFEVIEGRFTGRPLGSLCFGPGKLGHAERFAAEQGLPLSEATFYTDSASDATVMEVVGRAVAVNPDPTLRRMARKKGWEVVDWGG